MVVHVERERRAWRSLCQSVPFDAAAHVSRSWWYCARSLLYASVLQRSARTSLIAAKIANGLKAMLSVAAIVQGLPRTISASRRWLFEFPFAMPLAGSPSENLRPSLRACVSAPRSSRSFVGAYAAAGCPVHRHQTSFCFFLAACTCS